MTNRKTSEIKEATAEERKPAVVVIEQPKIQEVVLEIAGTASLIQHNFGQKAVEELLRKHMGISVQREAKRPREVLEQAKCKNTDDRISIKPAAIKKAMVAASVAIKGLKKTHLQTQLYIAGNSIPITYESETPRMDIVRLGGIGRQPDVRFRPEFHGWKARVAIQFSDPLSVQTVVDLLHRAGKVGLGEWRPERSGEHGTFTVLRHIEKADEIAEVHEECSAPIVGLTIPLWAIDQEISPQLLAKLFRDEQTEEELVEEDTAGTA